MVGRNERRLALMCAALLMLAASAAQAPVAAAEAEKAAETKSAGDNTGIIAMAAAAVVGLSCLAAGYAVARVGSAALGAASERPELLGRSLILVGLAEGIAIYGLIIGIMLLQLVKR